MQNIQQHVNQQWYVTYSSIFFFFLSQSISHPLVSTSDVVFESVVLHINNPILL